MVVRRWFPASPASVGDARRFVAATLDEAGVARASADVAVLVVSELATNSVRHAGTAYEVAVVLDDVLRIEVSDGSLDRPRVLDAAPDAGGGRGVQLVDQLASQWGVEEAPGGKCVWWEDGEL
jgi:anti-sigma regulatory factor (Ser/Thr protein kinase)